MASVRQQGFAAIAAKLDQVRQDLDWPTLIRNPRGPVGEDQMNALLMATGGEPEPDSLTSHVSTHWAEFSVGMVVMEADGAIAEDLLDAGFVAVCNALLDPADIQLGGLVVQVRRQGMSPPFFGRSEQGKRIVGTQSIDFAFEYWAREGDAEQPGP